MVVVDVQQNASKIYPSVANIMTTIPIHALIGQNFYPVLAYLA